MSWELVEVNSRGWKHYIDSHGNDRYQRPNGEFASAQQFGGGISHDPPEPVEPEPEPEPPEIGYRLPRLVWDRSDDSELASNWKLAINWRHDENGISITHYPLHERLDQLERKTEVEVNDSNPGYWSIEYVVIEETESGTVRHESRLKTPLALMSLITRHRNAFKSHFDHLIQLLDSYKDVLVLETAIHERGHE